MSRASVNGIKDHFRKNSRIREYAVHSGKVHTVAWNCDGRRLASGSFDKMVCTFTYERDSRIQKDHVFKGHSESVDMAVWHPSHPDLLATASCDRTLRIWDARSPKSVALLQTKGENINVSWSPDGSTIAVGNKDDCISFVDERTYRVQHEEAFEFEVNEFSWNVDGDLFALTSGAGCVKVLTWPNVRPAFTVQAHASNCIAIKFDSTGRWFAVGSADALYSVWDAREFVCTRNVARLDWPVRTLAFSFDGELIAAGSEDHLIDIAHSTTGSRVAALQTGAPTFAVAWHPRAYLLAFTSDDRSANAAKAGNVLSLVSADDRDAGLVKVFGFPSD